MSTRDVTRAGVDTYVSSSEPKRPHGNADNLRIANGSRVGLVRFKSPVPGGANVLSAFLEYDVAAAADGTFQLTVQRADKDWTPQQITWEGRPGGVGTASSDTITNPKKGATFRFDVTDDVQAIAYGAKNRGWRITSNNAATLLLRSMNAPGGRPRLIVNWSKAPQEPTKITPSYGVVGEPRPTITSDFTDKIGSTRIRAIQVQLDPTGDWADADLWDSGEVLVDTPILDLADDTLFAVPYPGLAEGAATIGRVRVQDSAGLWSGWSDEIEFTYRARGTLVITAPDPAVGTVGEHTPPIVWQFTPPAGETQSHFQVLVARADKPTKWIHDSGKLPGADQSYSIPKSAGLQEGVDYILEVRAWDSVANREATPGCPVYVSARTTFRVVRSATEAPVTNLAVAQVGESPWFDLTWTDAFPADSYTILRDGVAIEVDLEPGEVLESGTSYRYRDWSARPSVPHTWEVLRKVNQGLSDGPAVTATSKVTGIWIGDPTSGDDVVLGNKDYRGEATDKAEVYQGLNDPRVVRSVMTVSGLVGSCQNLLLRTRNGVDWQEYERRLYAIKARPADTYRLVIGELSIPVAIGDLTIIPHEQTRADQVLGSVSFSWWQSGEWAWEVEE